MLKKTLLTVAAAAAIMGGASALQPSTAVAGTSFYIGVGHNYGKHYGHNWRRCFYTYKRVWVKRYHRRGHFEWRRVRHCPYGRW